MNTRSDNDKSLPETSADANAPAAAGNGMPSAAAGVAGASTSNQSTGSNSRSSSGGTKGDQSLDTLSPGYPPSAAGDGMPAAAAAYASMDVPGSKNDHNSGSLSGSGASSGMGSEKKEQLRQEMGQLKSELDALVSHAAALSERELGEAYQMLMARFETYRGKARELASNCNQQFNQRMEVTRTQVKEKPMQAVAIAAGAGMLMGLMTRKRRRQDR